MASATLPLGSSVAGYTIDAVVGRGGMGVVYRARNAERREPVALKVLSPPVWDAETQELFESEARLAAAVVHRHILPVYEAGSDGGHPFLAMRLEERDLGALLRAEGRLGPARAATLVAQVASALDASHAHGLVHRDVKPQNVLLGIDDEGRECAYVADFGVARAAFSGGDLLSDALVGTVGYASPEQIRGESVDARSDVYSLGCLLYELLTGRPPFGGRASLATLWAHLHEEAPAPSLLRQDVRPALDAVVRRALAKRPGDRFGSAAALAAALEQAVDGRRVAPQSRRAAELPAGTVTFLFTDVEGSTKLLHSLGAEAYAAELEEHRRLVRDACEAHGGVEVDTQGDAFFFAFADAAGAVAAATSVQESLLTTEIRVRIGIHTGEPHLTSEGYVGIDVHRAARIAASAHGGQVVVSQQAARLVGDSPLASLGAHRLKDFTEPVTLYQVGDGSFPPLKTIANTNLPTPASSFLGRGEEQYAADQLLRDSRLLTIHGPGGQGKTRFALELARRAREERFSDYEDGVFACFLAPLRDPALVLPTIAHTLAVAEQPERSALESLSSHLGEKRMLLLIDNVEHVLECARELAELLAACPGLTLLATSRELLRIGGEVPYALPPLADDEGVELFCERGSVAPSDTVREICRRLEGLPLAIELAAARLRVLSPEQLLERLSARLDLLKGTRDADPRQQTLRATIQWSYDLLSPEEQRLFARLSVFAGGCTLEAAEEVCEADVDALESLLDKSLLRRFDDRLWMLETIREFAAEQLELTNGDAKLVRRRHARYFASSLAEPPLVERATWALRLEAERENLRAALSWALRNEDADTRLALASLYGWVCMISGPVQDGRAFLLSALGDVPPEESPAYARALWGLGVLEWRLGDLAVARGIHERGLSAARNVGDDHTAGRALRALGIIAAEEGDVARSEYLFGEALALFRELDDRAEVGECLHMLGWGAIVRGDYSVARELIEEALADAREAADVRGVARCASNLALVASEEKRFSDALELIREGLAAAHQHANLGLVGEYLAELARAAAELGEPERSALWQGGADAAYEATESTFDWRDRKRRERTIEILKRKLSPDRMEQLIATGRVTAVDDLVAEALLFTSKGGVAGSGARAAPGFKS
jgi:predicted ATPase/class 3 adenylate cyclase